MLGTCAAWKWAGTTGRALLILGPVAERCSYTTGPVSFLQPPKPGYERQRRPLCLLVPVALKPCTFKPGSLTPALTSDLTLDCAWTHSPSSAPDFVTEALRMKRSNLRRSASHGELAAVTRPRGRAGDLGVLCRVRGGPPAGSRRVS